MDMIGKMEHRAGSGSRTIPLSQELSLDGRLDHPLSKSREGYVDDKVPLLPLEWTVDGAYEGDCEHADSKGLECINELAAPSKRFNMRSVSLGEQYVSLEGMATRQRSKTDIRRNPVSGEAFSSGFPSIVSRSSPSYSSNALSAPIDQIQTMPDAEAIGKMMVAAKLQKLPPQYTMTPEEDQEALVSRRGATHRKDLKQWLGADAGLLSDTMDRSAFADDVVGQEGMIVQRPTPSVPRLTWNPSEMSMRRKIPHSFERYIKVKGFSAFEDHILGGEQDPSKMGHRPNKSMPSMPSMPQDIRLEREKDARFKMLQQRRLSADRPDTEEKDIEYPNKEELKAIQNDIRARTVREWMKRERRGTFHGYTLGF